jgi:hypothetical protein
MVGMSSLEALHQVAPSLQRRRTRSTTVAVATRQRLAQRDPREQEEALLSMSHTGLGAEVFYDDSLTVEEEVVGRISARLWLILALVTGLFALMASAVMIAG